MKTKLTLSVLAVSMLVSGCALFQGGASAKWETVARIVARRATYETVKRHPEQRQAFEAAVTALDNLVLADQVNYAAVVTALQKLPIKELKGDEGALYVADAIDLFDAALGDTLRLKDDSKLKPIVSALSAGIHAGLTMTP